ncbi:helix-turn-helix domain-containing protein [Methylobacterium sp. BTF04]|uniref:helix-turn-helix domain-containing protein n=1 Tax=Methylobacterium sp. BTF04 TaxID=2708300 RepID=UPI0013D59D21|nr:helix-turn-helix domain-containing protein [Methylobacterium sp. BTF04]
MYAEEIRRQAEAAPRAALPAVAVALWKAFGEGHLSETEAEALAGLIEARTVLPRSGENLPDGQVLRSPDQGTSNREIFGLPLERERSLRSRTGSRPRTDASMARRRRWAASGRLPPGIAAQFTLAEQAVLSLVAAETVRRKDCRLAVGHLAALAGVAETTVRNAIREAGKLGLVTVEERRVTGFRNNTNVVRIISAEWTAWLRLARKGVAVHHPLVTEGGGCKSPNRTHTQVSKQGKTRMEDGSRGRPASLKSPSRSVWRNAVA